MNVKKIKTDEEKKQLAIEQLDKENQTIVKDINQSKPFKTYKELEEWLKNFLGNTTSTKEDFLLQFMSKQQQPEESFAEYYTLLQHLAQHAFSNAPSMF